ncbi:MAG: hypothetical protein OEZ16_02720 [Chromatiales bacterium]|nr:hypothetical protein [Chromatiales bacterium]
MSTNNSRLLLEINKTIKDINREVINPVIDDLKCEDLKPVIIMVARARAAYLAEIFTLANSLGEGSPTTEKLKRLQHLRVSFEELSKGAQALETAIERGYLDVEGHTD